LLRDELQMEISHPEDGNAKILCLFAFVWEI